MTKSPLHYWLALHHMKEIGPITVKNYLSIFSSLEELFSQPANVLVQCGIKLNEVKQLTAPDWAKVESDLKWQAKEGCRILCQEDVTYPPQLKTIADPPLVLYVQGEVNVLTSPQIAMIGSRRASARGLQEAADFAAALVQNGLTITSGLALGIDGASHRGALAAQGKTIAVAGTGLQHIYPKSHQALAEQIIAQKGCYLSEFSLNMPPNPACFPRRNRIISGLSLGVLVVEAALKSGSLITAHAALEQGREVFAIPGSIHQPNKRGCHALLRQGAKLVETVEDVLDELNIRKVAATYLVKKTSLLAEERQILALMGYEIVSMDMLLLRSRLTADKIYSILLQLELRGHIQSVAGGYIRMSKE